MITRRLAIDRFDLGAGALVLVLFSTISLVIIAGDHVGLTVQSVTPQSRASSRATIRVWFDEPLQTISASSHFQIFPPVVGQILVTDNTLTFQPAASFRPNQRYSITLQAGLLA